MKKTPTLGLGPNARQFWLLVLVNAFVGSMVGLERVVLPLLAEAEFGLASTTAAVSFIATFGAVKALANVFAGWLGDRFGRRRVLIAGWLFGLPVPVLIILAPTWAWIIAANVLLGVNQGLAWSMTVIMKIDLAGPRRRGFAMGINEFAGYLAVALSTLASGWIAQAYGLRPQPLYLGVAFACTGLALSLLFVRETRHHADLEAGMRTSPGSQPDQREPALAMRTLLWRSAWRDPALSSTSQAGLVNNLNDGLAWGVLPLFFASRGLSVAQIGVVGFVYPCVWGILQLLTGAWSDRIGRRRPIVAGMLLQAAALAGFVVLDGFGAWIASAALLGAGTALVYPTLLAAVGDVAHPRWRSSAVGVYRLWRDAGYVAGAVIAGSIADAWGLSPAIAAVAVMTALSGLLVAWRMPETLDSQFYE